MKKHNVPALYNVDTRKLTKKLRVHGAMLGKIEFNNEKIDFLNPYDINLVAKVSRTQVWEYDPSSKGKNCFFGFSFFVFFCFVFYFFCYYVMELLY